MKKLANILLLSSFIFIYGQFASAEENEADEKAEAPEALEKAETAEQVPELPICNWKQELARQQKFSGCMREKKRLPGFKLNYETHVKNCREQGESYMECKAQ